MEREKQKYSLMTGKKKKMAFTVVMYVLSMFDIKSDRNYYLSIQLTL